MKKMNQIIIICFYPKIAKELAVTISYKQLRARGRQWLVISQPPRVYSGPFGGKQPRAKTRSQTLTRFDLRGNKRFVLKMLEPIFMSRFDWFWQVCHIEELREDPREGGGGCRGGDRNTERVLCTGWRQKRWRLSCLYLPALFITKEETKSPFRFFPSNNTVDIHYSVCSICLY